MALGILAFNAISTNDDAAARRWLNRVVKQPRVPKAQVARLIEAYRQAFGREWAPDQPAE